MPDQNFGDFDEVATDGSPIYEGYLKFDLSSLAGLNIKTAKLRINVTNGSGSQQIFWLAGDNWDENTITYNSVLASPVITTTRLNSIEGALASDVIDIDMTYGVQAKAGGILSMAIKPDGTNKMTFSSKEAVTGSPELIVYYEPAPPPTDVPVVNSTARWVLGGVLALALACVPAIVTWGAMGARLTQVESDLAKVERHVEKIPALDARLANEERHTIRTDEALDAMRSDATRTAEAIAETNGILKVILKD